MEEPLTEELLEELLAAPKLDRFAEERAADRRSFSEYLEFLQKKYRCDRASVIRGADLDATYGYQLFKGLRKNPSRDVALQLAFSMGLDLRETNRLLQAGGSNELYCKDRRDAIIIFNIDRKRSLLQVNESLFAFGEKTIGK